MKTRIPTLLLFATLIANSIFGQIPKNAISIEDKNFNEYFQNDKNIPIVKGKILNLPENEAEEIQIDYSIVTPFAGLQIKKNCKPNIDGTFELELDYAFPYQQIWLHVGKGFYAGIYANTDLFIELDAEKIKSKKGLRYNGDGVKYLGTDGELNSYLNNHVLFKRKEQLDINSAIMQLRRDRKMDFNEFILKYDSLFSILNEIDNEFINQNPSEYSWLIINDRQSDYYADLCSEYFGKKMSPALFEKIKNHKVYLTSNNGMLFNKYLYNYISFSARKGHDTDYKTFKSLAKLGQSEKTILDTIISIEENIASNQIYDTIKYLSLVKSANIFLYDTLVTMRTSRIINRLDSISSQSKSDLLKLHISSKEPNEQKLMMEVALNNIKTDWCKGVIQEQYNTNQLKLASIEKILVNSKTFNEGTQLGQSVAEMSFGAKLYKVDTMNYEILLSNLKTENKGKALIIDFWATWCGSCINEMPYSKKIQNEAKDLPIEFVYLCTSKSTNIDKWKSKIAEFEIGGTHIFVEQKIENELMNLFSLGGFPSYVFIDKNGDYKAGAISRMSYLNKNKLIELID